MSPRVIILGGNPETVSLFEVAKKMGLFTIACNPYKDSPVKLIADLSFEVDPRDAIAIDKIILEQNVRAVILGVSDPLLPVYKLICERNKLRCYANCKSVYAFSSKSNFYEICQKYGLSPIPQFGVVSSIEFEIGQLSYPGVVKPVDGGAALGLGHGAFLPTGFGLVDGRHSQRPSRLSRRVVQFAQIDWHLSRLVDFVALRLARHPFGACSPHWQHRVSKQVEQMGPSAFVSVHGCVASVGLHGLEFLSVPHQVFRHTFAQTVGFLARGQRAFQRDP